MRKREAQNVARREFGFFSHFLLQYEGPNTIIETHRLKNIGGTET